jgi:CubicO group peptidase (beta-lactamase class C family)
LPPFHRLGEGVSREKATERFMVVAADTEDPMAVAGMAPEAVRSRGYGANQTLADPASVGMSGVGLARVDSIIRAAVADSAASAVAVAIGRHGRLVSLAGYGELAYGSGRATTTTSIFDLASLSKVVGTTTAVMELVGDGLLDLEAPVVSYLPWWSSGDPRKADVTVRQLLLHRAGLPAFRTWFLEIEGEEAYRTAVAAEPLESNPGTTTVYSDLGAMTLGWIVEEVSGQSLDDFLRARVWEPLGMRETRYRPPSSLLSRIAATELDTAWRRELVWGTVHDENADAMGGVAGHAGLFSTVVDLSVFARMMLNGGVAPACTPTGTAGEPCPVARAEDVRLLAPDVVEAFTARHDDGSSRALGWDTPEGRSSAGDYFTARAYGHTGFTGTSIWIDPELDLWVVLLTNRVHPTRDNQKHVALRRAVHDAAALAIIDLTVEPRRP